MRGFRMSQSIGEMSVNKNFAVKTIFLTVLIRLNISRKLNLRGNRALVKFVVSHKSEL